MMPKYKPQATQSTVLSAARQQWKKHRGSEPFPETFLLGAPGYYLNTMGKPGVNDRGIYDDALFVVGPNTFAAFNGNTDPSAWRKGIATLLPGVHPFRLGNHGISRPGGGYPAFRPATKGEALPVRRDGESRIPSARPGVAINIHKGSRNSTSSEGCQTIHPDQWSAFYSLAKTEMSRAGIKKIEYILLDPGTL